MNDTLPFVLDHKCCSPNVANEFYRQPLRSDQIRKAIIGLLLHWRMLADQLDISFWLEFGTLLGAFRNQSVIPYDDDADIGVPIEAMSKLESLKGSTEVRDANPDWVSVYEADRFVLRLSPVWSHVKLETNPTYHVDGKLVDKDTGVYLDIFGFSEGRSGNVTCKFPGAQGKLPLFPRQWYFPLEFCELEGQVYSCPRDASMVLTYWFGRDHLEPDHVQHDGQWIKV